MRYAWDLQNQYLKEANLDRGLKGLIVRAILHRIRTWDQATANRVDHFVANSQYIAKRIKEVYSRDSIVIYPPVDIEQFQIGNKKEDFFLTASRMVPYKKIDLIVDAFSKMPDKKLIVIGDGPDFEKVKEKAGKNVEFLGYQKDDVLKEYLQKARSFLFAAEEDFGILPVEAQACGTPVIAFGKGGVKETVIPVQNAIVDSGQSADNAPTGILFYEQSIKALIEAVKQFQSIEDKFEPYQIRKNAERFGKERFKKELKEFLDKKIREFFSL